jgi:hypothetical protein
MTAIRTITRLQDADDANVTPAVGEDGKALVYDHGTGKFVLADRGGGSGLPLTAGSGEALTGTLYMDPGADDSAQLFRVPTTSANNGDILFNVGSAVFSGVTDVVFNLGFNNPVGGGKVDAALHSWYLQMENDYRYSNKNWAEFHLNLYPATGTGFRPFQFQYTTDTTEGLLSFRVTDFGVFSIDGAQAPLRVLTTNAGANSVSMRGTIQLRPIASSSAAMQIFGSSDSVTIFNLSTSQDTVQTRSAIWTFAPVTGNAILTLSNFNSQVHIGPTAMGTFAVTASAANQRAITAYGASSQTAAILNVLDSGAAELFAIGATGQIRTNQTTVNTAAPSGVTARQLPIYNASGTLLGYIPIYASAWS